MKILFEDNHIIVVEKPQGILSQGDGGKSLDMLTLIKNYLKEKYDKKGNVYLGLVHRLDQPVGGVMVFAKTSKAASRLSHQIREHKFRKVYLAICEEVGSSKLEVERIRELKDYLWKDEKLNIVKVVDKNVSGAKEAILEYEIIKRRRGSGTAPSLVLVEVEIKTGRSHQIRVQLAHAGLPIVNDHKYNQVSGIRHQISDIALWAYKLSFEHPVTKKRVEFHCDPPKVEPWSLFSKLN